ncbi:MAG: two-component system chemotaxis response regulator CheY [Enterobacterales bacterium]|jgi:two-component system chemotaxis response regulator CheY
MPNSETMLVVDDSKLARMMISGIAKDLMPDIQIFEATNGEEAINVNERNDFSIITIDYNMPGINGIELATQLKESSPNAHISLVTANIQDSIGKKLMS